MFFPVREPSDFLCRDTAPLCVVPVSPCFLSVHPRASTGSQSPPHPHERGASTHKGINYRVAANVWGPPSHSAQPIAEGPAFLPNTLLVLTS